MYFSALFKKALIVFLFRYVRSRNDDQLRGLNVSAYSSLADCEPYRSVNGSEDPNYFYLPCGLIAQSVFNGTASEFPLPSSPPTCPLPLSDAFVLYQDNNTGVLQQVSLKKEGIAWPSDKETKFANPPEVRPPNFCLAWY